MQRILQNTTGLDTKFWNDINRNKVSFDFTEKSLNVLHSHLSDALY